jgi:hypothetical protein
MTPPVWSVHVSPVEHGLLAHVSALTAESPTATAAATHIQTVLPRMPKIDPERLLHDVCVIVTLYETYGQPLIHIALRA